MKLGRILAALAIVAIMPRHIVAGFHAAGVAVPHGAEWTAIVAASSVALAVVEAATISYAMHAGRRWHVAAMLAAASVTFAPSIVADSAGLSLVALVGVATLAHYAWSSAMTATALLIVLTGAAADAEMARRDATERQAVERANTLSASLTDAVDTLRQDVVRLQQGDDTRAMSAAVQAVTVNVGQTTPPNASGSDLRGIAAQTRHDPRSTRESAVNGALVQGARTLAQIETATGIPISQIRRTAAWQSRRQEVTA